ncbi:MAG: hypothetical protein JXQ75_22970 [Phycisphaerae bacterium]|nr:hypothetical protein [Phycisphaerae bacterium]
MNEARRFLRYIIPGISTVCLTLLYCVISKSPLIDALARAEENGNTIGTVLAGVLASGGLGYLLSVFHHFLCSLPNGVWHNLGLVVDLREAIKLPFTNGQLCIFDDSESGEDVKIDKLCVHDAWVILNIVWHSRMKEDSPQALAESRQQSIWDLMHSAGALLIGSILSLVSWLAISAQYGTQSWLCFACAGILALVLVVVMWKNLQILALKVQRLTHGLFLAFFENVKENDPVKIHYILGKCCTPEPPLQKTSGEDKASGRNRTSGISA